MAAGRPAEDAVFVLQTDHLGVAEVQEVRRAFIRFDVLLEEFKAHFRRVIVALGTVVGGNHKTFRARILAGHGVTEIVGEGGNPALAWQIRADEPNPARLCVWTHALFNSFSCRPRAELEKRFQQFHQRHGREAAALVAHGVRQDQVACVRHPAATVHHIGDVSLPFALHRNQ